MYAVFELSGFQYNAQEGDIVKVALQKSNKGETIDITNVLLIKDNTTTHIGTPTIEGASVQAEILNSAKDDKVLVYKYKRRTKYRLMQGHRQDYSEIKIKKIVAPGA